MAVSILLNSFKIDVWGPSKRLLSSENKIRSTETSLGAPKMKFADRNDAGGENEQTPYRTLWVKLPKTNQLYKLYEKQIATVLQKYHPVSGMISLYQRDDNPNHPA